MAGRRASPASGVPVLRQGGRAALPGPRRLRARPGGRDVPAQGRARAGVRPRGGRPERATTDGGAGPIAPLDRHERRGLVLGRHARPPRPRRHPADPEGRGPQLRAHHHHSRLGRRGEPALAVPAGVPGRGRAGPAVHRQRPGGGADPGRARGRHPPRPRHAPPLRGVRAPSPGGHLHPEGPRDGRPRRGRQALLGRHSGQRRPGGDRPHRAQLQPLPAPAGGHGPGSLVALARRVRLPGTAGLRALGDGFLVPPPERGHPASPVGGLGERGQGNTGRVQPGLRPPGREPARLPGPHARTKGGPELLHQRAHPRSRGRRTVRPRRPHRHRGRPAAPAPGARPLAPASGAPRADRQRQGRRRGDGARRPGADPGEGPPFRSQHVGGHPRLWSLRRDRILGTRRRDLRPHQPRLLPRRRRAHRRPRGGARPVAEDRPPHRAHRAPRRLPRGEPPAGDAGRIPPGPRDPAPPPPLP